jgi:hypothetical protein
MVCIRAPFDAPVELATKIKRGEQERAAGGGMGTRAKRSAVSLSRRSARLAGPTPLEALRDQLGLKLESTKGLVRGLSSSIGWEAIGELNGSRLSAA